MYARREHPAQGFFPSSSNLHQHYHNSYSTLPQPISSRHHPLTPPEDMSSYAPPYQPVNGYQEQGYYHMPKDKDASLSRPTSVGNQYHNSQLGVSRAASPALSHQSYTSTSSHQRKRSSNSSIAVGLQIPKSINASHGSLLYLAATKTCLFWFEDLSVLDSALNPQASPPPRPLQPETIPTTGFRKWVTTILSTTQVAQNVVLLGLLFIYRLKRMVPSVKGKAGSEFRLLTVALMLGNKFLDDNTYTNKTWSDVSGISVSEIHTMEVEFLTNMKYNLFTSAAQWAEWHRELGLFAKFLERVQNPQSNQTTFSVPPMTLPSPPNSYQNSPPRTLKPLIATQAQQKPEAASLPASARMAPLRPVINTGSRKRSMGNDDLMPAAKRVMTVMPPNDRTMGQGSLAPAQQSTHHLLGWDGHVSTQLPPLSHSASATPLGHAHAWPTNHHANPSHPTAMAMALQSAHGSRHHSPYLGSTHVSPTGSVALPVTPTLGYGHSPSIYLAHRDSPYKPVRHVQTLLMPPPSRALHQPEHVNRGQMHYQPLGRPIDEAQQGRLPYITQNQWYEGKMVPPAQWPGNPYTIQQRPQ